MHSYNHTCKKPCMHTYSHAYTIAYIQPCLQTCKHHWLLTDKKLPVYQKRIIVKVGVVAQWYPGQSCNEEPAVPRPTVMTDCTSSVRGAQGWTCATHLGITALPLRRPCRRVEKCRWKIGRTPDTPACSKARGISSDFAATIIWPSLALEVILAHTLPQAGPLCNVVRVVADCESARAHAFKPPAEEQPKWWSTLPTCTPAGRQRFCEPSLPCSRCHSPSCTRFAFFCTAWCLTALTFRASQNYERF